MKATLFIFVFCCYPAKMKRLFVLVFIFVFSVFGFSQAKPSKTPPVTTIDAITKDGKAVILKSDGRWVFNSAAASTESTANASVNIEAALVYRSGEVVPVTRTKFYLLSESAAALLDTPELRELLLSDATKASPTLVSEAKNPTPKVLFAAFSYEGIYPNFIRAGLQAIIKAKKFETTSDFQGKASFQNIPKGAYYLFVISQARNGAAVWNVEIKADSDRTDVVLDQNNAASVR